MNNKKMNETHEDIFTMPSVKKKPLDPSDLESVTASNEMQEVRALIRAMVLEECYGWPVEKEEHLYGVKSYSTATNLKDPKNPELKMPKGPTTRS